MNRRSMSSSLRSQRGVTLIELMVAMVLGLIVAAGIITVFLNTSKSNRTQTQMARLQESGRFAIASVTKDLRMANAQYCASTGGIASQHSDTNNLYVDGLLAPKSYAPSLPLADSTTPFGGSGYPAEPDAPYPMPSYMFMRGYDCDKSGACTPANPPASLPDQGTAVGDRVVGSSVLTVRYFDASKGWSIGADDTITNSASGDLASITITPDGNEPETSVFHAGDRLVLADCGRAQIFAATGSGTFTPSAANLAQPKVPSQLRAPRLFDFKRDFVTVTYYLKVVSDDGTAGGTTTGALIRRVNGGDAAAGGSDQELVRGVERLDFRYAVDDQVGKTHYLTAAQVDDVSSGIDCPQQPEGALTPDKGCLWRAVKAIEVHLLVDGQKPLATLSDDGLAYLYTPDGGAAPTPPDNSAHTIKYSDQGFRKGMLRREFSDLVPVRNYNP